jgi:DNA-binding MurR/RpiR family transcriptional regulator
MNTDKQSVSTEFQGRVKMYEDKFSRTERDIASFLTQHEDSIKNYSIQTLADSIGVGVASIVRFSKTLGYQGFADMKFQIQQGKLLLGKQDIGVVSNDDSNIVKQKVLQFVQTSIEKCILELDNESLTNISNSIANSKKVYIYGSGTASTIAETITALFTYNGIFAYSIQDSMLHLRSLGYLEKNDVLIAINYSGYSKDISDCLYFAKETGATTVLLTSRKKSLAGKYADYELIIPPRNQNNSVNVATSSICQLAIMQIIQAMIQQKDLSGVMEHARKLKGHASNTYYDTKQEFVTRGRVRIVPEDNE